MCSFVIQREWRKLQLRYGGLGMVAAGDSRVVGMVIGGNLLANSAHWGGTKRTLLACLLGRKAAWCWVYALYWWLAVAA